MYTAIERKWEFVARKCEERQYYKAAALAEQIDRELLKIYGDVSTPAWIAAFYHTYCGGHKTTDAELLSVCTRSSFCIGCYLEHTRMGCGECRFGKQWGYCGLTGSLYHLFLDTCKWESMNGDKRANE